MFDLLSNSLRIYWKRSATPLLKNKAAHIGDKSTFHYVWLRDNCPCPECLHPSTRQKLISSADIPIDIQPRSVTVPPDNSNSLQIEWATGDSHKSLYDMRWLQANDYSAAAVRQRLLDDDRLETWNLSDIRKQQKSLDVDYTQFMNGKNESFKRAVVNLQRFGLTFITGCPNASQTVEAIGQRFGPIYETFYGRIFDVKSVPDAKNIAYTSLFLGLHMDLMYFESPPGLQLLHCLKCTVKGGDSIFADSYRAVEILREQYPEHFETLCRVPVTFHYRNNGHLLHFRRPTISADTDLNQRYHVYYAPPFQGPLEVEGDQVPKFYAAFKKFSEIINDPGLLLKRQLRPGDCAIFVNRRVLHGRLAFDRVSGERHLQGTYVGIDGFKDLYRTLMY